MTVEEMRAALKAGSRVRVVVGFGPDDPVGILSLKDGVVMWESVAGWSAGVVEPACAIDSDYLGSYLERESVEILDEHVRLDHTIQATIHKAEASVEFAEDARSTCVHCHREIRRVPGGHGSVWVHADTGAVVGTGAATVTRRKD